MRLGIMQPYFFPYLGHFSLIAAVDEWVVFDISQYTPRTWMNRNRVLSPAGGCKWITVPLANGSIHKRTSEIQILDPAAARKSVIAHLSHYKQAPYYPAVIDIIDRTFTAETSLTHLNARALSLVCAYIGMPFNYQICSDLALDLPPDLGPGDWAREICAALRADAYVNPAGGAALFDSTTFENRGVDLLFLRADTFMDETRRSAFEPNLSILDVLMWTSPSSVLSAVHRYTVTRAAQNTACSPRSTLTSPATSRA